jgi:hypothetical protein
MEVSGHSHAPATLPLCRESCYTLSMKLHGPGSNLHLLNKRNLACNCQGLNIMIIHLVTQSLNCNASDSLKFLCAFLSSPMRVTRHANRKLLKLIILRKHASRTSYKAPHYADCYIVLSIPPFYYQILFSTPVAKNPQLEHVRVNISAEWSGQWNSNFQNSSYLPYIYLLIPKWQAWIYKIMWLEYIDTS